MSDIAYRAPRPSDAAPLRAMARASFADTFGALYDRAEFHAYCDGAFGADGSMAQDLSNPAIHWRIAVAGDEVIGYAKLSALAAPQPDAAPGAMELRQIYVRADRHGTGIAEALMQWALATARQAGASELYLTVFDHNARAKRFYARHGFAETGRCSFALGSRIDDDRIWGRTL